MKVKIKIKSSKGNAPQPSLTKEDIREAVCNGIIQADEIVNPTKPEGEKIGFWKAVRLIIRGKGSENSSFATVLLSSVLSIGFNILFGLGMFVLAAAICATIKLGVGMTWECAYIFNNVVTLAFMALICILLFLISIMFRGAANDIKCEKDRNYIVSLFSGIVSFVALVISVIALYQSDTSQIVELLTEIRSALTA